MQQKPTAFTFQFGELAIHTKMLEELMGYSEVESCPEPVSEAILSALESGPELCNIRGGYVITNQVEVRKKDKTVFSHEQLFETKQIVTHQLRRSEMLAWFLCSAGEKISERTQGLMKKGDLILGYALDILANAVVETAMDRIQESLRTSMEEKGLKITNRYSPGYCDWNISEQKKLFKIFPENYLGISLTESSLMIPIKSVSGVIGIGKEVTYNEYTCNLCDQQDCVYRRIRKVT